MRAPGRPLPSAQSYRPPDPTHQHDRPAEPPESELEEQEGRPDAALDLPPYVSFLPFLLRHAYATVRFLPTALIHPAAILLLLFFLLSPLLDSNPSMTLCVLSMHRSAFTFSPESSGLKGRKRSWCLVMLRGEKGKAKRPIEDQEGKDEELTRRWTGKKLGGRRKKRVWAE